MEDEKIGMEEGEKCNREGCEGIIEFKKGDGGCYCNATSMPPCSYCERNPDLVCSSCGEEIEVPQP